MVSPELLYAEKLKGSNISEPKDKKEEEEGEKEEDEEEEDNKKRDDDDSSTNSNSNVMSAIQTLPPFDNELTHILTIVCGFPRDSNPVKAIKAFGLTTFDDFPIFRI